MNTGMATFFSSVTAPATREAILDAVEALLGKVGYAKLTMEDIAREASVSRRTVYCHFPNKQDVVLCSIDRIVDRVLDRMAAIAESKASPASRLRLMLRERVLVRFDGVQSNYTSLGELLADIRPAYMERRRAYNTREAELLAPVIEQGIRIGAFDVVEPLETAVTLVDATNALLPVGLSLQELGSRKTVEKKIDRIAELLVRGLATQKA